MPLKRVVITGLGTINPLGNCIEEFFENLDKGVSGASPIDRFDTALFKYAKIYYSALRGDEKELARGLRSSASFIRSELARRLNLRMTPELTFIRDTSLAHGAHIASVLHKIEEESPHIFDEEQNTAEDEVSEEATEEAEKTEEDSSAGNA